MTTLTFNVPGIVRGQARTGGSKTGARFKTPETKLYENRVAMAARDAMEDRPLFSGPMRLLIVAAFQAPSSASRKRRAQMLAGDLLPTVKPDWDNIAKITDALTGIVWCDDKQVVYGAVRKIYALTPGLTVTVSEVLP